MKNGQVPIIAKFTFILIVVHMFEAFVNRNISREKYFSNSFAIVRVFHWPTQEVNPTKPSNRFGWPSLVFDFVFLKPKL